MNTLYSHEAELSVIGAAMIENDQVVELAEIVRPDDFYLVQHRTIWGGILNLSRDGKPCDLVTLGEYLEAHDLMGSIGTLGDLAEIARAVPVASNAAYYAEVVADLAQRRQLIGTLPEAEERIADRGLSTTDLITELQGRLESLRRSSRHRLLPAAEYIGDEFLSPFQRRHAGEEESMGLPYGLRDLDEKTMGMKPGELVVVGGRPSMGKTAFMMNSLRAALDSQAPVLIESLEMKRPALFNRLVAGIGDIPIAALRDPRGHWDEIDEHIARIAYPVTQIKNADLYINHDTPRTISQIRAQAKEVHDRHGRLGLVMIDYLGKVKVEGNYKRHDLGIEEIVAGAKAIAKEFDCPVMLLSQLNRSLEQRPNKRPNMGDLKDSSAIEQEADTILFLYRDEVYHPDNPDNKGLAEIIIGKQREGVTDTVHVVSRLSHARFEDLAPRRYEEEF
ncbi:replicative DNA helicase [Halomonas caseinilytica]|uniref:replicative DNA helicase n=1 Tax=Halomonas caseinilytica TaxID=438744 RepID=UPI0008483F59|nr:replicative DNA helicase [Halomonas caseinilytica]